MDTKIKEISIQLNSIIDQLEISNRLLGLLVTDGKELVKDKAIVLLGAGLRPKDIAYLLNIPLGSVTKARSRALGKTEH